MRIGQYLTLATSMQHTLMLSAHSIHYHVALKLGVPQAMRITDLRLLLCRHPPVKLGEIEQSTGGYTCYESTGRCKSLMLTGLPTKWHQDLLALLAHQHLIRLIVCC